MLGGVGFEDEELDISRGGFVDELFDEGEAAVVGVESEVGVCERFLVNPGPGFVDVGEIGDDEVGLEVDAS